jgi:hypothetical protein
MPMSLWCTKLSRTTLLGKKTQKPTTQKKKNLYNDNKISSRKIEKRFVHEALHVVETAYLLGLLVVMWHHACIQPLLQSLMYTKLDSTNSCLILRNGLS